jgi:redox-sensitive bicupin YhaK (pirin superfamily)
MKKTITHILYGKEKTISEEDTVRQSLPGKDFRFASPFIVVHHMGPKMLPAGSSAKSFPHPHRGFAPVTFILQGALSHMDNAGHTGSTKAGDAQWMFAGKGLMHDEIPTEEFLRQGGMQEILQLWINVPQAYKQDAPSYQLIRKEQQPQVLINGGVDLRLVSGPFEGKTGPMKTHTPIIFIVGNISKGKQVNIKATPGYWTLLYIVNGGMLVNGETQVAMHNLIVFEKENDEITIEAKEDTQILFMSAEPINEPVAAKGNFVMNTPEEIKQAFDDFENGKFGSWPY